MRQHTIIEQQGQDKWVYENAFIVPSCLEDGEILGPRLRQADKDEIKASVGEDPRDILKKSIEISRERYTVKDLENEEPLACFGVAPYGKDMGLVWFLGSNEIVRKNRISFLRNSEFWVQKLFKDYRILFNVVDARNKLHIRWLKWLGFEFIADIPEFGVEKRLFRQFVRCKDD